MVEIIRVICLSWPHTSGNSGNGRNCMGVMPEVAALLPSENCGNDGNGMDDMSEREAPTQ